MISTRAAKSVISVLGAVLLTGAGLFPPSATEAAEQQTKHRVVIQVSDDNPGTWNQALNVAQNVPAMVGKNNVEVEIVAFGKGIGMLKFDSEVGGRISDAQKDGTQFRACGVTMKKANLTEKDMHPGIPIVPAGVVEIMKKQEQGWFVIRP